MDDRRALRELGLFDARAPRYTSYPPANHFSRDLGPAQAAAWLGEVPAGARISLYVHVPYCRRLCWFCACRTQGTLTERPLVPYLAQLKAELALVGRHLRPDLEVAAIHLGGGTPTLLPPAMLEDLLGALRAFRPLAPDAALSVEIDPTEIDAARLDALARAGLSRASLGVQDFDPEVQEAIGRTQPFELTRDVAAMVRDAGVRSLNMDLLYGLPRQGRARMAATVEKVLALAPDRLALYGYAHVPWMARRQSLIPEADLPGPEERLDLFECAARLLEWDGFEALGIDHFARPGDPLALAAREGRMRRSFQGYTEDGSDILVGIGASAISRLPGGYVQNAATTAAWGAAVGAGRLAVERGHALSPEDRLRGDMIESLLCRFELDLHDLGRRHAVSLTRLLYLTAGLRHRFGPWISARDGVIRLLREPRLIARLAARTLDAYAMPEGRHSRAL